MNVNCNIIRDLLPLYAEGMASEESKALVDDHLRGCDSCTKELAELKKAPRIPASEGWRMPFGEESCSLQQLLC